MPPYFAEAYSIGATWRSARKTAVPAHRDTVPKLRDRVFGRSPFLQPNATNPPRLWRTVSITQIWTAFLATLTTFALGLLWVFSHDLGDERLSMEGEALRAVANASLAALESEIDHSQVVQSQEFARSPRLVDIARKASRSETRGRLSGKFRDLAYQGPIATHPELNLALVDAWGDIVAEAGLASDAVHQVAKLTRRTDQRKELRQSTPVLTLLAGHPFVFSIQSIKHSQLRLISLAPLYSRGDGPLRRSLGSQYPAALINDTKLVLELSGSGEVGHRLKDLPTSFRLPAAGIGEYFMVGNGVDRRIGVAGHLAEKYRFGASKLAILVLSSTNCGYQGDSFWARYQTAQGRLSHPGRAIFLLVALWMASVGLSVILPRIEWVLPIRRLIVALENPQGSDAASRLAQGRWSATFEPLVIAIGRRILRTTTHRGWKVSTGGPALGAGDPQTQDQDTVTVARDASPTAAAAEPAVPHRKSA